MSQEILLLVQKCAHTFSFYDVESGDAIKHIRLPDYGAPQPLGEFSVEGSLDDILGRFEKAVLERLFHDHPSSRQLGKRLGVSHTTIANKLRQHGLGKE